MREDATIYHLVPEPDFRAQLGPDAYRPADLHEIGFVHCAARGSVVAVANDYYAGVSGPLLVLAVDPGRLSAETRYEAPATRPGAGTSHLKGVSRFPHVYGPIEREAISGVAVLARGPGGFEWPASFIGLEAFLGAC